MRPGQVIARHTQDFDQASEPQRLADGSAVYRETDHFARHGPFHVLIEANSKHDFAQLGPDNAVARGCSYRTPQGEVVEHRGRRQAYR